MASVTDMDMAPAARKRRRFGRDTPAKGGEVVLGEDWDRPEDTVDRELSAARERRGLFSLDRSPLARKIILFNLLAILMLVAGVLFLNPSRDSLLVQREQGLVTEARLIADIFQASLPQGAPVSLGAGDGIDVTDLLERIDLPRGVDVHVFDTSGALVAQATGDNVVEEVDGLSVGTRKTTIITSALNGVWEIASSIFSRAPEEAPRPLDVAQGLIAQSDGGTAIRGYDGEDGKLFTVATPILAAGREMGMIAITTRAGEIDALVRVEREQLLQMFVIALLVSIGLSLVLASTIANPLSDLSAAAELGRDKHARKMSPQRVRIPDLTARPDEIGRLSGALRGMVAALYDQRGRLVAVIEHDVRRLDRLVSDISNASRLDSELVKEEEEPFDLVKMISNLAVYNAQEAELDNIDFITDLPKEPIVIMGLEARLAQVFVNLITNALSFCEEGDAVRVWLRRRENRVLVVVEDTGPGIPEAALTKVFNRFYSERPEKQFGNHSGLGLAISKQIVEAHGGVIWAENIRPTDMDLTSDPLGARFVVGLPI